MGNVSGRKDEAGTKIEKEESMEYAHGGGALVNYHAHNSPFPDSMVQSPPHNPRAYSSPFIFTPQMGVPTMITWSYGAKQVAIVGSWDNWKTREFLQKSGKGFTIMKVLPSGVYHYQFIVDGQWRYSHDLPQECDDSGNIFNVLDLQDYVPEVLNNISGSESPPSPDSGYNNSPFSSEDFSKKLPELPPLLQQSSLDQPSSSRDSPETLEKPLAAGLNHLYIQKGCTGQSLVALSSAHRFRSKYVTLVLYKPLKKVMK
ncbi:SNF1-related protein kinase regulatory subunit beta-2-like isoform X2 [Camellia sinensis]|uniref:SNF1-related protein kinase regulatory subunit beta-2-like isoform X2 n=1 Tax=Camellia sinensis TaxID=4442 RepID=UPI0010361A91|nr:SNF1-related protein kinase regulatory subunit beta-2-like isoform X2 [Camellia sinensis]